MPATGVKIRKITIELTDGTVKSLEGTEAQKWEDAMNSVLMMGFIHGEELPEFPWKVTKPTQVSNG